MCLVRFLVGGGRGLNVQLNNSVRIQKVTNFSSLSPFRKRNLKSLDWWIDYEEMGLALV